MQSDKFLFVEKYRPKTINDCILPPRLKDFFNAQVKKDNLQNMILLGGAGTGKCLGYDTEVELMVGDEVYEKIRHFVR